jgi:putative SOS response-associated peptidase YedK
MCGRFALFAALDDILDRFEVRGEIAWPPRYNIAPTQPALVVVNDEGNRRLATFGWGLIPSWAKDGKIGSKLINARAETLFEKPSFRSAAKSRRCLVLANGFYEWRKTETGKVPMFIRLRPKQIFGFAGLWESWRSPVGETVKTCAIVTTEPNELMATIHNRMPVIVPRELEALWLAPETRGPEELGPVLQPYPAGEMEAYAVSRLVNAPTNDRPECIAPA